MDRPRSSELDLTGKNIANRPKGFCYTIIVYPLITRSSMAARSAVIDSNCGKVYRSLKQFPLQSPGIYTARVNSTAKSEPSCSQTSRKGGCQGFWPRVSRWSKSPRFLPQLLTSGANPWWALHAHFAVHCETPHYCSRFRLSGRLQSIAFRSARKPI